MVGHHKSAPIGVAGRENADPGLFLPHPPLLSRWILAWRTGGDTLATVVPLALVPRQFLQPSSGQSQILP